MRPPGARTQTAQAREELSEILRPVGQWHTQQVDVEIHLRIFQHRQHLAVAGCMLPVAQRDYLLQRRVVTFRVKDANLVVMVDQSFNDSGSDSGLTTPGRPCNQDVHPIRRHFERSSIEKRAHRHQVLRELALQTDQVVTNQLFDQFGNPSPAALCVTRAASCWIDGTALLTATAHSQRCRNAWSFSASPMPTVS